MSDLPRSVWNGTLRLRELVVPVALAPAQVRGDPGPFRLIHAECGQLIGNARSCPEHGEVTDEELVKGWEVAPGEYVPIDADDFAAIAPPETRTIDVYAIVADDQVDPLLVKRAWYLVPPKSRAGREGYAALEHALRSEELVGIARFTAWNAEHLAAVRPHRYVLTLQELVPHADLRDAAAIAELAAAVELDERTCELARKLVARLEVPFEPALLTNLHRERVTQLLDTRLTGGEIVQAPPVDETAAATASFDIAAALELSLRGIPRSRKGRVDEALART